MSREPSKKRDEDETMLEKNKEHEYELTRIKTREQLWLKKKGDKITNHNDEGNTKWECKT